MIIKWHNCDSLFQNYLQTKLKEERRNFMINGKKNYGNALRRCQVLLWRKCTLPKKEIYIDGRRKTKFI